MSVILVDALGRKLGEVVGAREIVAEGDVDGVPVNFGVLGDALECTVGVAVGDDVRLAVGRSVGDIDTSIGAF